MAEASAEMEVPVMMPPEDLRCKRSDGKSWRCSGWRIHDKKLCEKHYMQSMSTKRKSLNSPEGSKGKEKGFEDSEGRRGGKGGGNKSRSLALGSGGTSQKRRRGRHGEKESSEEVLPNKKIRNLGYGKKGTEEENKRETETEREQEEEESDKEEGKRNKGIKGGKRKKKLEIDGGNTEEEKEEEERGPVKRGERSNGIRSGIKMQKIEENKLQRKEGEFSTKVKEENAERGNKMSKTDLRRKYYSNDDSEDDCQMCHQCMASNKKVVRCRKERKLPKGCRRRYCEDCLKKW